MSAEARSEGAARVADGFVESAMSDIPWRPVERMEAERALGLSILSVAGPGIRAIELGELEVTASGHLPADSLQAILRDLR